jgi:5,5'-dehydrodivanillate O-demethylase
MEQKVSYQDFVHTGPGTLAGRFLRMFWQPVYCSHELSPEEAVPVHVLDESFTLYRGHSGTPYLVGYRCAHRGTQLSVGRVEDDCIRCFYHGWKYAGSGQCVEQPAESKPFADTVTIPSYPVREYLGLIFAYLGSGEPPAFTRYPKFENPDITLDTVKLDRICNYFNNIDNSLDNAHVRFVHQRHRETADDHIVRGDPTIAVEETDWGIRRYVKFPNGTDFTAFFGMPNINYLNGQVVDAEIKRADVLIFKVPSDDEHHFHFEVRAIPLSAERAGPWLAERRRKRALEAQDRPQLVRSILQGKLRLRDLDARRTDYVMIEDEIAQTGQGEIADRDRERLGQSDRGVIMLRKLWERELSKLVAGQPTKSWSYHPDMVPTYPRG